MGTNENQNSASALEIRGRISAIVGVSAVLLCVGISVLGFGLPPGPSLLGASIGSIGYDLFKIWRAS